MFICSQKSPGYPSDLTRLPQAPPKLYIRGNPRLLEQHPSVGIVGARRMSDYGKRVCETFVPYLASRGCVIVSGLAFGIDVTAHKLTLESGGATIAVLGSGINYITPKAHERIGQEIIKKGALVSEYPGRTPAGKYTFPARNRIIAALSDLLIVIEGTRTSGSLITADFMLQLGKDVYAVPGNIDAPLAQGTNFLIANGATPLICLEDLELRLGFDKHTDSHVLSDVSAEERMVLELLTENPCTADELCTRCALPAHVVNATLTTLELKGGVTRTQTGLFSKR